MMTSKQGKNKALLPEDCRQLLQDVQTAINGNGHDGLKVTVARIDANLLQISDAQKREAELSAETRQNLNEYIKATGDLTRSVALLDASVNAHHKKRHLTDMMGQKTFYTVIVIGFIVLHILASYIPYGWDAVVKIVGLPALTLPPPY